ncbi:MAG: endonuclease domain-containing protein [Candidatus Tectomicrobia bacterium]|nr:endonuclease domain-containing protein [Candidatus Tectomicrobia bacterium]
MPQELLIRCRRMRRDATDAEARLWRLLRNRQLGGWKFRRQHAAGPFFLDFYCHEAKIAIELDGGGHAAQPQRAKDAARTRALTAEGIRVLRFWDSEVSGNIEGVAARIWDALTPGTPSGEPLGDPAPALSRRERAKPATKAREVS